MTTASSLTTFILLVLVIGAAVWSAWAFHADRRDALAAQQQHNETEPLKESDNA